MRLLLLPCLLAASALAAPCPAAAQESDETAALRAEVARLRAELDRLEARLDQAERAKAAGAGAPAGQSAPPQTSAAMPAPSAVPAPPSPAPKESLPSIKPRGRLQLDASHVSRPDGINAPTLGWSTDVRRAYLGADGELGAGFGYRLEVDFAPGTPQLTDAWMTYETGRLTLTLGHHRLTTLEDLTSDLETSMLERAAYVSAFGLERRLGLSATYAGGDVWFSAGIFADDAAALGSGTTNDSFALDARLVYMPRIGGTQFHFGGSLHHRELNNLVTTLRYQARPGARTTDMRFVDTGLFSATAETGYGLEFAAARGPVHVAAEGFWQHAVRPDRPSPTFFGGYGEIGYVFAGADGRSYRNGTFGAIKPRRGLDKGGAGAWQVNLRYDWLDLNDSGVTGGTQRMLGLSLVWAPIERVKFMANYLRVGVEDTPVLAGPRGDYDVDVLGLRAQYDF